MLFKFFIKLQFKKKVNLIRTLCHHSKKNCSAELLSNEIKQIKLLLNKNKQPQELVKKKLHLKNLDRINTIEPEKFIVTSKVPFINKSSEILEKKIKHLIRNAYYAANPRIVFTTSHN